MQFGPIIFPFTGYGVGGSHISTFLLAGSLKRDLGVETLVIAVEGSTVAQEAAERGLRVETVPGPATKKNDLAGDVLKFPSRRKFLRLFGKSAVVHVSDLWTAQAWGLPAKSLGLKYVYHHRAFITPKVRDRALIRAADAIISISEACSANLQQVGIAGANAILNPFDSIPDRREFDGCRDEFERHWKIDDLKLVGFSANFQTRKRARFFVDAAAAISRHDDRIRFVVFGRDRDESAAELAAHATALGIGDRILFPGFRSPPERNIAALDVLAVPALAEPFGRTLVEALLLGVPYVATDDAGHSEIARRWKGGVAVPPAADPRIFADQIVQTIKQGQRGALSATERAEVALELQPATHAAAVMNVYRKMVTR